MESDQPFDGFSHVVQPSEAQEPILARPVRNALLEWSEEIWAADALAEVNIAPRRRALFSGLAGTGKTTLAHHLAARLGLPMAIVRPDDVHGRYIGNGTANIKRIFDTTAACEEPLVLFFDEFDTIAQKRMHSGTNPGLEHDHNAMINTLLARLDAYSGYIIAATNKADAIDASVWRRFDIQIAMELPGQFERERIIARYLAPFGMSGAVLKKLGTAFETATPALIRQFCEGLKRQIVVGPRCNWDMRKEAVVERLIAAVLPHPDAGKPRLWSQGSKDEAVRALPWPLPRASEIAPADKVEPVAGNIVRLGR